MLKVAPRQVLKGALFGRPGDLNAVRISRSVLPLVNSMPAVLSVRFFGGSPLCEHEDKRTRRWGSLRRQQRLRQVNRDAEESEPAAQTKRAENRRTNTDPKQEPDEDEEPSDEKPKDEKPKDKKGKNEPNDLINIEINATHILWVILGTIFIFSFLSSGETGHEVTYQEFRAKYLDRGEVTKLQVINNSVVRVFTRQSGEAAACYFTIGSVETLERHLKEAQDALNIAQRDRIPVAYVEEGNLAAFLFGLIPTLMFLGFLVWMGRKTAQRAGGGAGGPGGVFGIGKTKAQRFSATNEVKVRFADVAGMDEPKLEIMEFVQFLKNPKRYERLGAKIPRGAILSGAPGTGKTLLAKATAGEAGVPFYAVSGSEFVEMFSGVGASRVRDLFKKAKAEAPSMIWIDEIDAIGKSRSGPNIRGGNDEREATLNQLLVEMDGFGSNDHVVVMAGTNRADVLDTALLRPGRFDRHIQIDLPTLEGRKDIYEVHLKKVKYDKDIAELAGKLAAMTPGFSGADIANCCNEAALAAARSGSSQVEMPHFEQAIDRVIAGLERRSRVLPTDKRKIVAYHEAGHAVCGWFLRYADPLVKVTIVPHGAAALGYAQLLPSDNNITTENRMIDLMTVALGGRVSEEIFFPSVTVGASDDFKRITGIARAMVCDYGMSPEIGAVRLERQQGSVAKGYSDHTDSIIDQEVSRIIGDAHKRCKELLSSKREAVEAVAKELLSKEVLTRNDLVRLLGERPFKENEHEAFKKYLDKQ